jgi:hypothetical protein
MLTVVSGLLCCCSLVGRGRGFLNQKMRYPDPKKELQALCRKKENIEKNPYNGNVQNPPHVRDKKTTIE